MTNRCFALAIALVSGFAVLAACGSFGGDDGDPPAAPSSSSGTMSDSGPSSSSSSSGQTSSSSSSSSSSSGVICTVTPCPGNAFCETFARSVPDEQGWTYRGTSPLDATKFKIDIESGDPCKGRFFASQEFKGSTLGSRIMGRKFAVTSAGLDVGFDFTYGGQIAKVVDAGRAVFAVVTPDSEFTLNSPYVALALTNGQFVLLGHASNGEPMVSTGVTVEAKPQRVTMHVSATGLEPSSMKFAAKDDETRSVQDSKMFPALGTDLKEVYLVLGAAVANVAPTSLGESVNAYFDNVEVANQ